MRFRHLAAALLCCTPLLYGYSDCRFRVAPYEAICEAARKEGVSVDYANRYLLDAQTKKRDFKSLKLFAPKMIKVHHANEKRANNALIGFVPEIAVHLKRYSTVYDVAEKRFGVNREIVAAILAKETRLGRFGSGHDAFTVFNTLVCELSPDTVRNKRLIAMAERNIVSLMRFCYANGIAPGDCRYSSSYAGAVGIPQFMPQNFYLVESYGGGPGNLEKMEDAILSTARFLHDNAHFTERLDWEKVPDIAAIEEAWYDYDFAHENASFSFAKNTRSGKTYNCYACDKPELRYLSEYVKKIMRYNNSSNYALGVLRLAWEADRSAD